jgi:hypothetical protein
VAARWRAATGIEEIPFIQEQTAMRFAAARALVLTSGSVMLWAASALAADGKAAIDFMLASVK